MLLSKIVMHAGGGWEGHVFFRVEHPISKVGLSTNVWENVEDFCKEHNLEVDDEIKMVMDNHLEYNSKYGWLVPQKFLNKNLIVTSAMDYLKQIQNDIIF